MVYHGNSIIPRSFRIHIAVDMATVTAPFTPFAAELNFTDFRTEQDANATFYTAFGGCYEV